MAQAVKKPKEPPLGGTPPSRKVNLSVVPIAAGIKAAAKPEPAPAGNKDTVVSIHAIKQKQRVDFTDDLTYELHSQLRRVWEERDQVMISSIKSINDTVEVEVAPSPLPKTAAGASPATMDQSRELAAYLAHWNPMGSTRHIPTKEGYVRLKDGTEIKVQIRQDFIDDEYPGPYNGFEADGMVFYLSGDREYDRRRAKKLTRTSQKCRESMGKTVKTQYQNLVLIDEYRPVPDVDWFLRNPDGKSHLRGDLNPYPPGIMPSGDNEASYIEDKKQHSKMVTDFMNFNTAAAKTAANMMSDVREPTEVGDWIRTNMMAHDHRDAWIMRGRVYVDDLPWSYDEPIEVIDQVSTVAGSDATAPVQRAQPVLLLPAPSERRVGPLDDETLRKIQGKTKSQLYRSFRMPESVKLERDAEDPAKLEDVVVVRQDGLAVKVQVKSPEALQRVAEAVSTMQPESSIERPGEHSDESVISSIDLTDRRALATLEILERRVMSDVDDLLELVDNISKARVIAKHYRQTGQVLGPDEVWVTDAANDDVIDVDWSEVELEIERIPACRVMHLEDIGLKSKRIKSQVEVMELHNTWARTAGFRRMIYKSEELQRKHAGYLRVWDRAWTLQKAARMQAEINGLRCIRKNAQAMAHAINLRMLDRVREQKEKAQAERIRLNKALRLMRDKIPNEVAFLQKLGSLNTERLREIRKSQTFIRKIVDRLLYATGLKKVKRTAVMNLGMAKIGQQRLADPPSVVPTVPTNVKTQQANVVACIVKAQRKSPSPEATKAEESSILLPKVEVFSFNDPATIALRKAHMHKLIEASVSPEELVQEDRKLFKTSIAQRAKMHREQRGLLVA